MKTIFTLLKTKFFLLLQIIGTFLLPIKALLIMVAMMIVIDTISGLWKAYKNHEPITSHKLSRVISKMVLYQVGVITFFILDKFMLGEFLSSFTSIQYFLTKVIAIFFCGVELISLNENIKEVYGVNFFDLFKSLLIRVKDVKNDIEDISIPRE